MKFLDWEIREDYDRDYARGLGGVRIAPAARQRAILRATIELDSDEEAEVFMQLMRSGAQIRLSLPSAAVDAILRGRASFDGAAFPAEPIPVPSTQAVRAAAQAESLARLADMVRIASVPAPSYPIATLDPADAVPPLCEYCGSKSVGWSPELGPRGMWCCRACGGRWNQPLWGFRPQATPPKPPTPPAPPPPRPTALKRRMASLDLDGDHVDDDHKEDDDG